MQGCDGGYMGCGTVYSFDPATRREKALYVFCAQASCADGDRPSGDLVAVNGILYGTTVDSGSGTGCSDMGLGCGTVFSLDPATRSETVVHAFGGATDGGTPEAGPVDVTGILYGTTEYGGSTPYCPDGYEEGCGTVYSIDPTSGAETILHAFKADGKDGEMPTCDVLAVNGTLYGTTQYGGANDSGTPDSGYGFLRSASENITRIAPLGSSDVVVFALNNNNAVTGDYQNNSYPHSFVQTADGKVTTFDPKGSVDTAPDAINSKGAITGYWQKENPGPVHGFLRTP